MTFGKNLLTNNSRIYINRYHKGNKGNKGNRKGVKTPNTLGGDPAAPSGTATLLRLQPTHQGQTRPTHRE